MLNYSDEGLAVRPVFFAPYNEITVIVEDMGKENFYTQVLKGLLGGKLRIYQVLGVGGKDQVIQRYEGGIDDSLPREFYLVDGDFDELLGRDYPDSVNFYRLYRYDIESYLLEEDPICLVAEEESPAATSDYYKSLFQIGDWISEVVNASLRLVACVALLQELDEGPVAISQSIERFVSGSQSVPDLAKIESAIDLARSSQSSVDHQEFDRLLEEMITRMGGSDIERRRWISGKHILVPLAIRLLRLHTGRNVSRESLCFRLAKGCEFKGLAELRDRIVGMA